MVDRGLDVLEKYDFEVSDTAKGRGALILKTDKGQKALKEYKGSGKHLVWTEEILEKFTMDCDFMVDSCVRNKDGEFISESVDKSRYIVKNWFDYRECDVKNTADILMAVRTLAKLHNVLEKNQPEEQLYYAKSPAQEMKSHNQEIKKIRKFLYTRNNRTEFELLATKYCDYFYGEGLDAMNRLEALAPEEKLVKGLCHGDFNFHNICFVQNIPAVINFDKQNYNYLMSDLYSFMRKILEKNDWDYNLGYRLIDEYDKIRNVTEEDIELLAILFTYPEKFWKILNGYFNSNKAWISGKKSDKLKKFIDQNEKRLEFIRTISI